MPESEPNEATVFDAARQLPDPHQRAAFLDAACQGDTALRQRVEELLSLETEADARYEAAARLAPRPILNTLPPGGAIPPTTNEKAGDRIGPYKLLEQIGAGGMGAVWMAEQTEPIRRRVALKVIKQGLDTGQVMARFEAERQALALMDHPNIAKVLDAGSTTEGRPYFVMELVKGIPLIRFCDEQRLSIRQRLELFMPVCQAIQHAHQKGVIHRDIKPSNVLVALYDGRPVPKVIDFGIAKATGQQLTEKTLFTSFGTVVGTLEYMSPEQAELNQIDIDTRSDIYSLGVLLYELLTGSTPLMRGTLRQAAFDEVLRRIREEEPPRPSTRLSDSKERLATLSAQRQLDPARLTKLLRGDLDWIVMKCLEKDRNRRYETANGVAADIQRHLDNEPVQASPPSARYRFTKFVRKHRHAATAAAAFALLLIAAATVSTVLAIRANREWARAEQATTVAQNHARIATDSEADTEAFARFLVSDVLETAGPTGVDGRPGINVTVVQALEAAEPNLDQRFVNRPRAEAITREALGKTWDNLGQYDRAERHLRRAVELSERLFGAETWAAVKPNQALAIVLYHRSQLQEAITLGERNLEIARRVLPSGDTNILTLMGNLAVIYQAAGRVADALPLLEEVLKERTTQFGPDAQATDAAMFNLAQAHHEAGRSREAVVLYEQCLANRKRVFGPDHPNTLLAMNNLGAASASAGRTTEAMDLLEKALSLQRTKLGPDHPTTLQTLNNVACIYQKSDRLQDAIALFEEASALRKSKLGPDHRDTLEGMENLAKAYREADRLDDASRCFDEALLLSRTALGSDHPRTLSILNGVALTHIVAGRVLSGCAAAEEALTLSGQKLGRDHPITISATHTLGLGFIASKRPLEAIPLFEQALAATRVRYPPAHPDILQIMDSLARTYRALDQWTNAVPLFEQIHAITEQHYGQTNRNALAAMRELGRTYLTGGRLTNALPLLEEALTRRRSTLGDDHPDTAVSIQDLAEACLEAGRFDQTESLGRELLASHRRTLAAESLELAATVEWLGGFLLRRGHYAEAEILLRENVEILQKTTPNDLATGKGQIRLGAALLGLKKYAAAENLLLQGYQRLTADKFPPPARTARNQARYRKEAAECLGRLYTEWGKLEETEEWRKKLDEISAAPAASPPPKPVPR